MLGLGRDEIFVGLMSCRVAAWSVEVRHVWSSQGDYAVVFRASWVKLSCVEVWLVESGSDVFVNSRPV